MAKICYTSKKFTAQKLEFIKVANEIISAWNAQGYSLTVRQIYYQFVSRDLVPNRQEEYDKLGEMLSDARLAGLIDWDAIVDRTRNVRAARHYAHPRDIVLEGQENFRFWKWEDQPNYVEVWVEKDALSDVVDSVATPLDVAYFACRGYTSASEMHAAAMRFKHEISQGKEVRVIHVGDHDPSGIDMSRDITERITQVFGVPIHVYRVALNMNQIKRYNPPPNPAKVTDSRAAAYIEKYGDSSWELDALEPSVLAEIIESNIIHWRDDEKWARALDKEKRAHNLLKGIGERWNEVVRLVRSEPGEQLIP